MPGIETGAPERTETSSGFVGSPNFLPVDLLESRDVAPRPRRASSGEYAPFAQILDALARTRS